MRRIRDMLSSIETTGRDDNVIPLTMEPADPHALPPAMTHAWRQSSEMMARLHELRIRRAGCEEVHASTVAAHQREMNQFDRQIADTERQITEQHNVILTMLGNIGIVTESA